MSDDIGTTFLENKVNGVALLVMGREDFKEIGVTQVGPLAILLEEIKNLCQEKKAEAVFVDQNAYCFGKIIDTLRLRAMCQNDGTSPPLYMQEPQKECFKKVVDYYFPGEWSYFISEKNSKHRSFKIERWFMEAGASIDLDILYQGSLYLWYASYFNVKCDNKGTTITLI